MNKLYRLGYLAGPLLLTVIAGCGGGNEAALHGNVTMDGEPLASGTVTFHPQGGQGAIAYGQIDARGNYELRTGTTLGLTPGNYQVTVVAYDIVPNAGPDGLLGNKLLTPAHYRDPKTSGLICEVAAGGNQCDLELVTP